MDKSYYICHYCIKYKTTNKPDMLRHFCRKNKCKCETLYSYDDSKIISSEKKFCFIFDNSQLTTNDYLFIIIY